MQAKVDSKRFGPWALITGASSDNMSAVKQETSAVSEASENSESCAFPGGSHTFAMLYTEDNGAPAILKATVPPPSVPEPATLALLGTGLLGLAIGRRRKRS